MQGLAPERVAFPALSPAFAPASGSLEPDTV